jgi:hypothetical protein
VTLPVRFFFDECLSKPIVECDLARSLKLYGSDAQVVHLLTKFSQGCKDPEWIPALAHETGWVVITCDQGKNSKKSEKLPEICRAFGVTHVTISRGLHKRNMYYKSLAIMSLWGKLLALEDEPRGGGYRIAMTGESGVFRLALVSDAPKENEILDSTPGKHQQFFSVIDDQYSTAAPPHPATAADTWCQRILCSDTARTWAVCSLRCC